MTAVIIGEYQLNETEEMALYELSLANELSRGKRYRWRRDTKALFQMVDDAFKCNSPDVIKKAVNFFSLLPTGIQHEFLARRISPPSESHIKSMSYRGAPLVKTPEAAPQKSKTDIKKTGKKHVWRGVTYED